MKLTTAKGCADVPPEEKIIKNKVVDIIAKTFERYAFAPLETPILERFETLAAKFGAGAGSDVLNETFKLSDQGKRKLGLRFELTTSLGRYVAMNPTIKLPFKRYEIGRNFRDGPIKLGRAREFWQCDADTVGSSSMLAEAEQLAILNDVFKELNFKIVIKINNRKILNGILNQSGIKDVKEAIIAIDKLDKIGKEGVSKELKERGYSKKQIDAVLSMVKKGVKLRELKQQITEEEGKQGIAEMEELLKYLKPLGVKVDYDVSLARGQAYYTGTVLEVFLKNSKVTSSIASGGRFDNMIGGFLGGGRTIPACGISFGLTPMMEEMKLRYKDSKKTPAQVLVIPINTNKDSLAIAQELRSSGINTDFAIGKKGVSKNLQYANTLRIPFVIIVGEKELKKDKVQLRDMKTGEEKLLSVEQVIKKLQ